MLRNIRYDFDSRPALAALDKLKTQSPRYRRRILKSWIDVHN